MKKIFVSYLEGGLAGGVELDVKTGFVLLLGLRLGCVWRGQNQTSWV